MLSSFCSYGITIELRNCRMSWNGLALIKQNKAPISSSLFCIGVPVRHHLEFASPNHDTCVWCATRGEETDGATAWSRALVEGGLDRFPRTSFFQKQPNPYRSEICDKRRLSSAVVGYNSWPLCIHSRLHRNNIDTLGATLWRAAIAARSSVPATALRRELVRKDIGGDLETEANTGGGGREEAIRRVRRQYGACIRND